MNSLKANGDMRSVQYDRFSRILSAAGVYAIIVFLFLIGIIINRNFLTITNLKNVLMACAQLGILCGGMGFITYIGKMVDMSSPITISMSGIVAISCLRFGLWQCILLGILASALIGVVNGIVVGKFNANPIIWTLAMNFLVSGLVRWIFSNKVIYPDTAAAAFPALAAEFSLIARTNWLGLPISLWIMLAVIIIGQFLLVKTSFGKQLKVIGVNPDVARYSGINVTKNVIIAYILAALGAGIAGIFITSMGKVGAYYNGDGYDFMAATAIVLGGMTLSGGRGNMAGVLGGVITVKLLSNIQTFLGISTFVQNIITGIIFILIVYLNSQSLRKLGRDNA